MTKKSMQELSPELQMIFINAYHGRSFENYASIDPKTERGIIAVLNHVRLMSENAKERWRPIESAPKNGSTIIGWVSSENGFKDMSALFYYRNDLWHWEGDNEPIKRQDLIHGWQPFPQPPKDQG